VQVLDGEWSGDTALTAVKNAISAHRCDVVKLLVELGCDVNMTDSDGWYVQCRVRAGGRDDRGSSRPKYWGLAIPPATLPLLFPSPAPSSSSIPLEVATLNTARGSGERCSLTFGGIKFTDFFLRIN